MSEYEGKYDVPRGLAKLPSCKVCGDLFRANPAAHDLLSALRFETPAPGGLLKYVFPHNYQPVPARKK